MKLGFLAAHVATIVDWAVKIITLESFDVSSSDSADWKVPSFESSEQLLAAFDSTAAEARAAIAGASDETLMQPWPLLNGDHVIFTLPRVAAIRSMVYSHLIHHRAQLGVYLRLLDIPIPGMYGPSADDAAVMREAVA